MYKDFADERLLNALRAADYTDEDFGTRAGLTLAALVRMLGDGMGLRDEISATGLGDVLVRAVEQGEREWRATRAEAHCTR